MQKSELLAIQGVSEDPQGGFIVRGKVSHGFSGGQWSAAVNGTIIPNVSYVHVRESTGSGDTLVSFGVRFVDMRGAPMFFS